MHDHRPLLSARVRRTLDQRIAPAATTTVAPLTLARWDVTDSPAAPGQGEPVPTSVGLAGEYTPCEIPAFWGAAWGTTWFHLTGEVPESVRGQHLEVRLDITGQMADEGPGFQAEALVLEPNGRIVKAINPRNRWIRVDGDAIGYFLECAANPPVADHFSFKPNPMGAKETMGPTPIYAVIQAEIVVVHDEVVELEQDLRTLIAVADELPQDSGRRWDIELAMDRAMDALDLDDVVGSAEAARAELREVLSRPAHASAHHISAIGHAHIDTAWLWPIRETRRKVVRTIANVLGLIESGEPLQFALPAAQHVAWLAEDQPELFERLKKAVDDGAVHPVGSMWVEPDAVLPGGEAMCRQLTYGIRWFREHLGVRTRGVWLPDSFGYSGALPQLAALAGSEWFLTQKISWNQRNKFPHHTFWWEGIDGTRIFTHFPPADTYNAELHPRELAHADRNFTDKGRAHHTLVPFGWGDGGGGPTREMLATASRVANLEGMPTVTIESPDEFFAKAKADYPDPATWVGELYLELHRGTFTTQVATKAGNRRCEALLRATEWACAVAAFRGLMTYPAQELEDCWKQVLTQQFHDILPGSSIGWVYDDAKATYARVEETLTGLRRQALDVLGDDVSPHTAALAELHRENPEVLCTTDGGVTTLDNDFIRVVVDSRGLVTSLIDLVTGRDAIPTGAVGNLLQLHPDQPNAWDAWDIDAHYRHRVTDLTDVDDLSVSTDDDGAAHVEIRRHHGSSTFVQHLRLSPGARWLEATVDVDWHEHEKLLKLAWPAAVHTDSARYETQFGHIRRPIHTNTSWDDARFEVSAHRWVHVGEDDWGVAVANRSTYGWDITRQTYADRPGTYAVVRASVVRGPRFPDPVADQGESSHTYLIQPGAAVDDAVELGYHANRVDDQAMPPLVRCDAGAIVETVKMADDDSGDLIVRLYEPLGRTARTQLTVQAGVDAIETDLLEQPLGVDVQMAPTAIVGGQVGADSTTIQLSLRPFQVVTLRLTPRA